MLYKFKSQATGNLLLLEATGRKILGLIGKEPAPQGIIEVDQMKAAIAALQAAVAREEAQQKAAKEQAPASGQEASQQEEAVIALRQRAQPFIDMLQRAQSAGKDVTWGV